MKKVGCGTRTSKYTKIFAHSACLHLVAAESNEKAVLSEILMMLFPYLEEVFLVWFQGFKGKAAESHVSWMPWNLRVGVINAQFHYSDFALEHRLFGQNCMLLAALDNIEYWCLLKPVQAAQIWRHFCSHSQKF